MCSVRWKEWSVNGMMFKVQNEYFCNHCQKSGVVESFRMSSTIRSINSSEVVNFLLCWFLRKWNYSLLFLLKSLPLSDLYLSQFLCLSTLSLSLCSLYQSSLVCYLLAYFTAFLYQKTQKHLYKPKLHSSWQSFIHSIHKF